MKERVRERGGDDDVMVMLHLPLLCTTCQIAVLPTHCLSLMSRRSQTTEHGGYVGCHCTPLMAMAMTHHNHRVKPSSPQWWVYWPSLCDIVGTVYCPVCSSAEVIRTTRCLPLDMCALRAVIVLHGPGKWEPTALLGCYGSMWLRSAELQRCMWDWLCWACHLRSFCRGAVGVRSLLRRVEGLWWLHIQYNIMIAHTLWIMTLSLAWWSYRRHRGASLALLVCHFPSAHMMDRVW